MKTTHSFLIISCLFLASCQETFQINRPSAAVVDGPRFDFSSAGLEPARNFEADVKPSVKVVALFTEGSEVKLYKDSNCSSEIATHTVTAGEAVSGEIILTSSERLVSGTYYFSIKDSMATNCTVLPDSFQVRPFSAINKVLVNTRSGVIYRNDKTLTFWDEETHDPFGNAFTSLPVGATSQVEKVVVNGMAYAALKTDGSVVTWGFDDWGGNSSSVASQLSSGVVEIIPASGGAFAARKSNGSVYCWGLSTYTSGCNSAALSSGVTKVLTNGSSFIALKSDNSAYTWGFGNTGGNSSSVATDIASGVVDIFATENAGVLGVIKTSGYMVAWGHRYGGNYSCASIAAKMSSDVQSIAFSTDTFAAIRAGGEVIVCGDSNYGGSSDSGATQIASGVVSISKTNAAFAALKGDGTVEAWGQSAFGGNSGPYAAQLTGVTQIYSNNVSFAALKSDGSVVTWGMYAPAPSFVSTYLSSNIVSISKTQTAFAALKSDGSVVTWGDPSKGADSSSVSTFIASGIVNVEATLDNFYAYKADGSIVKW